MKVKMLSDITVQDAKEIAEDAYIFGYPALKNSPTTLMKDNPPSEADAPIIERMARLGIQPGAPFEFDKLDPAVQVALQDVPKAGFEKMMAHFKNAGENINGWLFTSKTGLYDTDYLQRALITAIGLGANRPQAGLSPCSAFTGRRTRRCPSSTAPGRFPR